MNSKYNLSVGSPKLLLEIFSKRYEKWSYKQKKKEKQKLKKKKKERRKIKEKKNEKKQKRKQKKKQINKHEFEFWNIVKQSCRPYTVSLYKLVRSKMDILPT